MSSQVRHLYEFGDFRLDTGERILLRGGELVPLTPKAFETLLALVEGSGHIMAKDELLRRIWPDTFVEEATLAQNVFTLRKALGNGQQYIETIPRRGYRFVAPVRAVSEAEETHAAAADIPQTRNAAVTPAESSAFTESINSHGAVGGANPAVEATAARQEETAARQARDTSAAGAHAGGRRNPKLGAVVIASAVFLAAAGVIAGIHKFVVQRESRQQQGAAASFQSMKVTRLPIDAKVEEAVVSPDGKYVAYVNNEGGRGSIWVRQVATTGNAQQIVAKDEGMAYGGLAFTRDSERIYYLGQKIGGDDTAVLYQVPVFGGVSKKVLTDINSQAVPSPDGGQIAFTRVDFKKPKPETSLVVAQSDGTNERVVVRRVFPQHLGAPAWSPDGKAMICPARSIDPPPGSATLIEINLADGTEKPFTNQRWHDVGQIAWLSDGDALVMNVTQEELNPVQLWELSYPGGEARRITNDLNSYQGASLTADSRTLVTLQTDLVSNIWVAPAGGGDASRAVQITQGVGKYEGYNGLSWTPDGRIVYASIASGSWDIWVMNADGTGQRQLTADAHSNYGPSVSADGRYIVFISNRTGGPFHVWRMDIDGGNPKQLTFAGGENFAHVTPDGQWVVYATVGFGQENFIWRVPVDGGDPVRLTDKRSSWPFVSPDGKFLICTYQTETQKPVKLALIPATGSTPVKLFDIPPTFRAGTVWTHDGRAVSYVDGRGGINNLRAQLIDGGAPRQLTDFQTNGILAYDWSRDGKLACSRGVETTGVVLIKDFR